MSEPRVIIAGGGTGGHLFPAISIGEELRQRGAVIHYIGSEHGLEATRIPDLNISYDLLDVRGIQRSWSSSAIRQNVVFPLRMFNAYRKARQILADFKPQVVVGTGGYSAGVPLLAAQHCGIPTVIQEQNSYPGITTRVLSKNASKICIAFEDAVPHLKSKRWILTGNPVRSNIRVADRSASCGKLKLDPKRPVVFILGGSQGARSINQHIRAMIPHYSTRGIQLVWQCGKWDFPELNRSITDENVHLYEFISDMGTAYSAADVVISRAGAVALAELTLCRKVMILIPLPSAAADHQTKNARALVNRGAAILIHQHQLKAGELENQLDKVLANRTQCDDLMNNAGRCSHPDALKNIGDEIWGLMTSSVKKDSDAKNAG